MRCLRGSAFLLLLCAWTPAPALTPAQQVEISYETVVAAGVQIVSTSTPALNGTYPVNDIDPAVIAMTQEQLYVSVTTQAGAAKFTNGQQTREWADIAGAYHNFPSPAEFTAFAEAVAQYYDALNTALVVGEETGTWTPPSQPVTIP